MVLSDEDLLDEKIRAMIAVSSSPASLRRAITAGTVLLDKHATGEELFELLKWIEQMDIHYISTAIIGEQCREARLDDATRHTSTFQPVQH